MAFFQLIDKATGEPAKFNEIDEKICAAFHQPVDEDEYYLGWYDLVGLAFCLGKTWANIRRVCAGDEKMIAVINWLEGRYDGEAWR